MNTSMIPPIDELIKKYPDTKFHWLYWGRHGGLHFNFASIVRTAQETLELERSYISKGEKCFPVEHIQSWMLNSANQKEVNYYKTHYQGK